MVQALRQGKADSKQLAMSPPAAKRQRSIDHMDSTRNISVVKGGLSIMCPSDAMGMLIGKGGAGLRDMQEKSRVKVTLQETKSMPEGAKERGVGLSGSLESIAAVEKIIFEKLEARRATSLAPSPAEEEHEIAYQAALAAGQEPNGTILNENDPNRISVVRWVMNNAHCGWLIGKGGSGIQNIENTSGAEVRVANEKALGKASGERIVYIKGTAPQRDKALELIRGNPKIAGRVAPNDEPETAAVHIPSRAIGFILGHRGTSIQALTEKTGAQLRVAPAHEITTGASEYRVDITGPPKSIVAARHALAARVAEWKQTNNYSDAPEHAEYSLKVAVPQPLIGHIIGKGGVFVREVLAVASVQVKIQQDSRSPTLWGDACCVLLSGTMSNVVKAQQMILERIANISDRLKEMVPNAVTMSPGQSPDDPIKRMEVNIQLPDGPPPVHQAPPPGSFQQPFNQQQQPPFGFTPYVQPPPSGPFPMQQPSQPPYQPQFQQGPFQQGPPPQQQQPQPQPQPGFVPPNSPSSQAQGLAGPPRDVTFTSIAQINAPGLIRANKHSGGVELLVDNGSVGSIIGKGGVTIRRLTSESGALIQVQGRDEAVQNRERRVSVTSTDSAVQLKACNLICAVLRNNAEKSNAAAAAAALAGGAGSNMNGGGPGPHPGQYNPANVANAPPPSQTPAPAAAAFQFQQPTPQPQQQQQPQQQFQFAPAPAMSPYPPQGYPTAQPTAGAPPQQAYQTQAPQTQQAAPQPIAQQAPPAQAVATPYGTQPQQFGTATPVYYQVQATNGQAPAGAAAPIQYAAVQQQAQQPVPQQAQAQQVPMQQQAQQMQPQQQALPLQQAQGQQAPMQQRQHVQQLPLQQQQQQPQVQQPQATPAAPTAASAAPAVYGWVYDPTNGTYTAAPPAATAAPTSATFPSQTQYSQPR